jgi:hypothetical protein
MSAVGLLRWLASVSVVVVALRGLLLQLRNPAFFPSKSGSFDSFHVFVLWYEV